MTIRASALVLALLFAASPIVGVICQVGCDEPPRRESCHESATPSDGPSVREAQHACDHDHALASPALVANSGVRDSLTWVVVASMPTLTPVSMSGARVSPPLWLGPPSHDRRSVLASSTALRI